MSGSDPFCTCGPKIRRIVRNMEEKRASFKKADFDGDVTFR